jgi:hypothetical protein
MSDGKSHEVQLLLFETQLFWQLFPHQTREQVSQLLGILCIDIIENDLPPLKDEQDE